MGPDLIELLRSPNLARAVPDETIPPLLCQLAALQSILASRLVSTQNHSTETPPEENRLLTAEEAASLLGVSTKWLYRHYRSLPFSHRLSRKTLRFSEAGLRRWLAAHR